MWLISWLLGIAITKVISRSFLANKRSQLSIVSPVWMCHGLRSPARPGAERVWWFIRYRYTTRWWSTKQEQDKHPVEYRSHIKQQLFLTEQNKTSVRTSRQTICFWWGPGAVALIFTTVLSTWENTAALLQYFVAQCLWYYPTAQEIVVWGFFAAGFPQFSEQRRWKN